MPSEFDADAAVIIEDKQEFLKRLEAAAAEQLANHEFFAGEVVYYDPYNDTPNESGVRYPEMIKHFSYAYQKEHRCVWRCPQGIDPETIEPVFLKLGPLDDIARAVYLSLPKTLSVCSKVRLHGTNPELCGAPVLVMKSSDVGKRDNAPFVG